MEKQDDNKTKSISYLVRSLIVLTLLVVSLIIFMLCNSFSEQFAQEHPTQFRCAVVSAPCGMNTNKNNYTVNGKDGKALYKANCSSCHVTSDRAATGPGLQGVLDRIPEGDWKYQFVRNSASLFKAGDAYTIKLRESHEVHCIDFPQLTNDEIDAILLYVQ